MRRSILQGVQLASARLRLQSSSNLDHSSNEVGRTQEYVLPSPFLFPAVPSHPFSSAFQVWLVPSSPSSQVSLVPFALSSTDVLSSFAPSIAPLRLECSPELMPDVQAFWAEGYLSPSVIPLQLHGVPFVVAVEAEVARNVAGVAAAVEVLRYQIQDPSSDRN
eukprot:CAMPEP_0178834856 /NCGR_PEP_ID=MMETSP0746-20121128/11313_1 /TAXON_ID=913974 /ORGANISM="Nitzschia punctata, Strain CCMP561" /LENGTH=162 /DNA_ID=CAMNT_0020497385 /DNA_START=271 /DNA_END=759 /DNA_ORIENTATION=+